LLAELITQSRNWFMVSFVEDWVFWFAWLEASLKLGVDDKKTEANVLQAIGDVQQFRKENDAALESYNEALKLFKAVGDKLGEANVLAALCRLSLQSSDIPRAEKQLESVIAMRRAIGDLYSEGADYGNFAIALLNLGNRSKAKEYALKARQAFEKVGEPTILKQIDGLIAACEK
jgi:tetratricopeptide (TPR) repeat protein